eukprot:gene13782-19690_t
MWLRQLLQLAAGSEPLAGEEAAAPPGYDTPPSTAEGPPPMGPLPPSPGPGPSPGFIPLRIVGELFGTTNSVDDSNLRTSVIINSILFGVLMALFCVLQSKSILYKFRLVSPSVSCKPPPLPKGSNALWAWLWATVKTTDEELLASAGLDALMMVKSMTMRVQLFPVNSYCTTMIMKTLTIGVQLFPGKSLGTTWGCHSLASLSTPYCT